MSINPDHVNLEKGGWKNILSFRTVEKNVLVEIYGRPMQKPNSGEFVMVRKGLFPLGWNSISKIYKKEKDVWNKDLVECDSIYEGKLVKKNPPSFKYCRLCMLVGNQLTQYGYLFNPIPSVSFCIFKMESDTVAKLFGIDYSYCDEIPFIRRFRKDGSDIPDIYNTCKDTITSKQLDKIFKKPEE
jgi:hypothetical protein